MAIIIIDSGGTSSDWAYVPDQGETRMFHSKGMNPVTADISSIVKTVIQSQAFDKIDSLYMYGAGCSTKLLKQRVYEGLSLLVDQMKIHIETDLLGAAFALCGRNTGVISILGTGSNTAVFDGTTFIDDIESGGYLLGDEGSGFQIAKTMIISYLRCEYSKQDQQVIQDHIKLSNEDILNTIYSADRPNHQIASYASIVQHLSEDTKNGILKPIFKDFVQKRLLPYGNHLEKGLFFCGSIAFHYQKELSEVLNCFNLQLRKTIPKPIEALVHFHKAKL